MYRLVLIFCLFLCSLAASAQQNKGVLSGKLIDSASKQPLSLATVTVFNAADTSIITYRLSNPDGDFRIPGIPHGVNYRVVITFSGYRSFRKEFKLGASAPNLDLGTLHLPQNPGLLEEVVVLAERPPVVVRNDTIEFNAASFKTLPTALVEDLLKKLPGVQVDRNGTVTVNGRSVNRILVDGKAFFGDDPKMATRNLPANLIDKVQVLDDKEEINRSVDGDVSDIGKVINLTLKKGVKKGWFGKAYGGGGTQERYEAGGIANIFRDTLQVSILGFSNNVNRSGFTMKDVQELGGFNRSGTNSMMMSSGTGGRSGFAINNISFGGLEIGINRTTGAGFNLNHAPNANKTFFAQYFYGHGRSDLQENSNTQQFIADTILNSLYESKTLKINASHMASAGLKLKLDSLSDLDLRASFSLAETDNRANSTLTTRNDKAGPLSTGSGNKYNDGSNYSYNHTLQFNKRSAVKKGRMLDISHNFSYNKNSQYITTEQINLFRLPETDTVLFEQLRVEKIPNINGSARVNFTEPLGKALSVRVSQQFEYLKDEQRIGTWNKNPIGKYEEPNDALTNGFNREQFRSNSTVAFTYRIKKFNLTAGANALWQDVRNNFDKVTNPVNMRLFDIMPTFGVSWKNLSVRYSENVSVPGITYLNPVIDNTNPFFIRESNPALKPAKRRLINGNYYKFIPKSNLNIGWYLYGQLADDDIILARSIDERGVQVTRPVNTNGTRTVNSNVFASKQFKNDTKFSLSLRGSLWISFNRQALLVNDIAGRMDAFSISPNAGIGLNWNDVVEFRPEYRVFLSQTRYTDNSFADLYVPQHNLGTELIVRWPRKVVWETNLDYRRNPQVAPGMPQSNTLWNAGLTYSVLKDDRGLIRLSVYDILNSNTDYYRQAMQNYIIDHRNNILQRYFLLTFTYNIQTMGAKRKIGGRERLFEF